MAQRRPAAKLMRLQATAVTLAVLVALAGALALALAPTGSAAAQEREPRPAIESVKGAKYRMAKAKMANAVTRYADAAGDQLGLDGTPATGAPDWTDIAAVYVAPTRMPAKLLTKMRTHYPRGTVGSFYGKAYDLRRKDRIVFVAVEMGARLPERSAGQQVEIGRGGDAATPLQAGSSTDSLAGLETFTLGGLFSNGAYGTGTTDLSGREPGTPLEADDYYNAEDGSFGFYLPQRKTWYLVVPREADTDTISVAVRSTTAEGQVLDRLELPGGGTFVDLRQPDGGFKARGELTPLTCRSLETFSSASGTFELSDPEAAVVRYTAGVDASADPAMTERLLAQAVEAAGPVPLVLTPVGGAGEAISVEGELALSPAGNAVSLTFEAPAGQWSFALGEELALTTPTGEAIIDHASLTGTAGVRVGAGLDGLVAGDPSCAAGTADDAAGTADDAAGAADDAAGAA